MNQCTLFCFLWICAVFGSNVDILEPDSLANENTCECGRDLTLPCKFKNKTFAIAWMNQNDISPIAQCVRNKCDINPKYIDQYNISYDETNHIFNLTIIKLTMKDNGRKLVCSDGTSTDLQLIRVKDNEPHLLENTTAGTIEAISGCISNVTKVSFKWIKIWARSKSEEEITPKIQNASVTSCSNDSDCGNDQHIQYSELISAEVSDNGNCYLKIVADYGDGQKESYQTVRKYIFTDRDEERSIALIRFVLNVVLCYITAMLLAHVFIFLVRRKVNLERCMRNTFNLNIYCRENVKENINVVQEETNQTQDEQSKMLIVINENTQSYNNLRKGNVTQSLSDDESEYYEISASNSHQDLPKHNEEEDHPASLGRLASIGHCEEHVINDD